MQTANIVSTPNITGNIGSCTVQTQEVLFTSGVFRDHGQTIATNSCTGEVQTYPYTALNGGSAAIAIFAGVFLLIGFIYYLGTL